MHKSISLLIENLDINNPEMKETADKDLRQHPRRRESHQGHRDPESDD